MAVGLRSVRLFYLAGDAGGGGPNYVAAEGNEPMTISPLRSAKGRPTFQLAERPARAGNVGDAIYEFAQRHRLGAGPPNNRKPT